MSARLERSRTNRVISGVCGGIGEYLAIDATFVRIAFVVLTFPIGIGLLIYIALLIFMPNPGEPAPFVTPLTPPPAEGQAAAAPSAAIDPEQRRWWIGIFLVAVGLVFLAGELGVLSFVEWRYIWPLVLIGLGVLLLARRTRPWP